MSLSKKAEGIIKECESASDQGINNMREIASSFFEDTENIIIGVNGSYARREVTLGSDVDLFFLFAEEDEISETRQSEFKDELVNQGLVMPSTGGVFETPLSINSIAKNIGGMDDTNIAITRRMLLLLEGEWIFNKSGFESSRGRLIDCYVSNELRSEQVCLYLLNDIIRYWRTICVDFEYKVNHDDKARNIRLIKLRFSRLMLYFAGLLAVGETYNKNATEKKETLISLFNMPGIQRIQYILNQYTLNDSADNILELYANFLIALNDKDIRKELECNDPANEKFSDLRNIAQAFREEVHKLIMVHYSQPHPMTKALII